MGHLYWLASYPKSGNTWTRILLTNYLRNSDTPADINDLEGGPIASARSVFDEHVGIEASDLNQDEIERYRPYVYEQQSNEHGKLLAKSPHLHPPFLKVHDAYTYTPEGIPLISKAATAGVIYLLRNPFDVAVSFAHHSAQNVGNTVKNMNDPSFTFVDDPRKLHNQLRQRLLTWSGHATSWLDEPGLRVLLVKYEDLLADTEAHFSRMLQFAGITPEPERVEKAVRFSNFKTLQQQEAEHGFREKMPKSKSFFRSGTNGSWKNVLSEELQAQIIANHGPVMQRFGYLNNENLHTKQAEHFATQHP